MSQSFLSLILPAGRCHACRHGFNSVPGAAESTHDEPELLSSLSRREWGVSHNRPEMKSHVPDLDEVQRLIRLVGSVTFKFQQQGFVTHQELRVQNEIGESQFHSVV